MTTAALNESVSRRRSGFNVWILLLLSPALMLDGCAGTGVIPAPPDLERIPSAISLDSLWYRQSQYTAATDYVQPGPLLSDGRLYFADRPDRILALEAVNGREIWRTELKAPPGNLERGVHLSTGFGAGAGLILAGTRQGRVIALDPLDGSTRWESQLTSEIAAPPVASSDIVVVRTNDGRVYGLNAGDGHNLWTYSSAVPPLSLRGASRLLIDRDRVYVGLSNGKLVALALESGEATWEVAIGVPEGRSEFQRLVDLDADPVLVDNTVYAAAYQTRLVAIATVTGRILWSRDVSTYQALQVVGDNLYLSTEQGEVMAIGRSNGTIQWRQDKLAGRSITGPVLSAGSLLVADNQGYLHWLSPQDGTFIARIRVTDGIGPVAPVIGGEVLYVADASGALQAWRVVEQRVERVD